MTRLYSILLAAVAMVVLLIVGVPTAAGAARSPAQATDGQFFSGSGGAVYGPFTLNGGRYYVDVWAQDNAIVDPTDDGCLFGAYIDGIGTPIHLPLSTPLRITSFPAWHYTPTVSLPAGPYKLVVLPETGCDWRVSILPLGPAAPGITVVGGRAYLYRGATFTPTAVVHLGQTIDFAIYFRLDGAVRSTPTGTLTISDHGGHAWSFRLRPLTDTDGTQQLYVYLTFRRPTIMTLGPAVATFTITAGTLHARHMLEFTLAD